RESYDSCDFADLCFHPDLIKLIYFKSTSQMTESFEENALRLRSASFNASILAFTVALQCPLGAAMAQPHRVTARSELRSETAVSLPADGPVAAPDVMKTVAMAVSRTPLYDRWSTVANAPVPDRPEVAELLRQMRGQSRLRQLDIANRWMNHRLEFASDQQVYGDADHWAPLAESLRRGRGDCGDYAVGKMQLLRAAGVPVKDMYL